MTLLDTDEAHPDAANQDDLSIASDSGERIVTNLEAMRPEATTQPADFLVVFTRAVSVRTR